MALIKVKGLVTRYKIIGKGTPIVFLHGWGGSSESFGNLQRILSRRYKTISLDLPGFGETDFPPKPWGAAEYGDFVEEFLKTLMVAQCYLVGHSFGGRIAILLGALKPERLKGLLLVASAGIKHEKSAQERVIGLGATIGKRLFSLPLVSRLEEPVRYVFYRIIRRQDYYLAQGVMKGTMQRIISEDLKKYLPKITLPALIIWGDKDAITPLEDAYLMKECIRGAELKIIPGGSHHLPRHHYKELAFHIKQFIQ